VSPLPAEYDPLLRPLVTAGGQRDGVEQTLRAVVAAATPLIHELATEAVQRGVVAPPDARDLVHEALLRLLVKLRQLVELPDSEPITKLDDYLATLFRHTIDDYRRRLNPPRAKLTHRVRYVLTHTRSLAVWGRDPVSCGLATWAGRSDVRTPPATAPLPPNARNDARTLRHMIEDVLRRAGGPVHLSALVDVLGAAMGIAREPFVPVADARMAAPAQHPDETLQGRQYLAHLWREVEQLPPAQRRALLLSLRTDEGESVARTLVALRIAGIRRIAAALEMPLEQMLELWNELPLPDLRIGAMLGRTRQQVINLRKSARERLARRLGHPLGSLRKGS
jgi:DNA-directed RNA polymerase specialized sigma24 family protein